MVEQSVQNGAFTLSLKPNSSATRQQVYSFIVVMAALSSIIAIAWAFVGVWIVLPFAGFEVCLVGYFLLKVNYRTKQKQLIVIEPDKIVFIEGHYQPERQVEFRRDCVTLEVVKPASPLDELKLALVDDKQRQPIAGFLVESERKKVRSVLREQGLSETNNRWWESD